MSILRIGRIELRVLDLKESVDYYTRFMGLTETGRDDNSVYLKAWDEYDHHSLVLTEADSPGVDHVAFKVRHAEDLEDLNQRINEWGLSTEWLAAGSRLAEGEALVTTLPTGHRCEFYHQIERIGIAVGNINPEPWPDDLQGVGVQRFDHCLLVGNDLEGATRFFVEVLDFHQSERLITADGTMLATFLHCTNKAHDIAFLKGPDTKLHHVGFYVGTWDNVLKAADLQSRHGVRTELTPSRHGLTRGLTTYFFDPSGNRNEAYSGGTFPYYDDEVVTWTEDQAGKAIFFHGREMIETFGEVFT